MEAPFSLVSLELVGAHSMWITVSLALLLAGTTGAEPADGEEYRRPEEDDRQGEQHPETAARLSFLFWEQYHTFASHWMSSSLRPRRRRHREDPDVAASLWL